MKKWCREPGQPPSLSPNSVLTVLAGVLHAVSLTNSVFSDTEPELREG